MISYKPTALRQALSNQINRLTKKTASLEKLSSRISFLRLLDVLAILVCIYFAARQGSTLLLAFVLIIGVGSFILLVNRHRRIDRAVKQFSELAKIRNQHLARLSLDWKNIPELSVSQNYNSHPFARDFNLVGDHSLLQLINTASYAGGKACLKKWLLKQVPQLSEIRKRQALVKELKPMAHFRDRLHLYANLSRENRSENDWSMEELLAWLQSTQQKGFKIPLLILGSLAGINILLFTLFMTGIIKPYVIISFVIYLLTYNFYSGKMTGLFDEASQIQKLLTQFREILSYLESYPYKKNSSLNTFCSIYHKGDQRPSHYLKKIIRIASAAALQNSDLVRLIINSIVPWDLYFTKQLNAYKHDLEPNLDRWLERFYQLEALNAIANFSWLNPAYTFSVPKTTNRSPVFRAENLGHPLIPRDQKVTNDVTISNVGDIQLITGSNMAGKSTFLRTIGINLALCFAGAPVDASAFDTILLRLFSSINVTDSLDEGLSHFYAEVKRLRALLDQLNSPNNLPLLFMVDEIYRGTNNRERLTGSTAFLKEVANRNGVGLVSTHDLELARLEEEIPTLSNWHFEETIEGEKMRFEYKLKSGPCPSTNALKIMEMEGLPI